MHLYQALVSFSILFCSILYASDTKLTVQPEYFHLTGNVMHSYHTLHNMNQFEESQTPGFYVIHQKQEATLCYGVIFNSPDGTLMHLSDPSANILLEKIINCKNNPAYSNPQ